MNIRDRGGDSGMVSACLAGDSAAWARLAAKYSGLIEYAAKNRLKKYGFTLSCQDIDDIRQDTLAHIWTDGKLKNVKNKDDIAYWLAIVAGNRAMVYLRRKRSAEPQTSVSLSNEIEGAELAGLLPAAPPPDDKEDMNRTLAKVLIAIKRLPDKEKLVAKLNFIHKKRYHEISKMLHMPVGTVASHVKRAKANIKIILKYLQ